MMILKVDGASRGNPGDAAIGVVVETEYGAVIELWGEYIGVATNNEAEYRAIISGLSFLRDIGYRGHVQVYSDSELVVNQLNGVYRVRSGKLKKLYDEVKRLEANFSEVKYIHVDRAMNRRADSIANKALDIKSRYPPRIGATSGKYL